MNLFKERRQKCSLFDCISIKIRINQPASTERCGQNVTWINNFVHVTGLWVRRQEQQCIVYDNAVKHLKMTVFMLHWNMWCFQNTDEFTKSPGSCKSKVFYNQSCQTGSSSASMLLTNLCCASSSFCILLINSSFICYTCCLHMKKGSVVWSIPDKFGGNHTGQIASLPQGKHRNG